MHYALPAGPRVSRRVIPFLASVALAGAVMAPVPEAASSPSVQPPRWQVDLDGPASRPLVQMDHVCVATLNLSVSAYRLRDGKPLWRHTLQRPTLQGPTPPPRAQGAGAPAEGPGAPSASTGQPATPAPASTAPGAPGPIAEVTLAPAGSLLVATVHETSGPGWVTALDGRTGQPRWTYDPRTSKRGATAVFGGPVASDRRVWVVTYLGLLCLDASSGQELWFNHTAPPGFRLLYPRVNRLVLDGDLLVHHTNFGVVYGIEPETGKLRWQFVTDSFQLRGTPLLSRFTVTINDCTPLVDGERVYVGDGLEQIYALRRKDGTLLWKQKPGYTFHFLEWEGTLLAMTGRGAVELESATGEVRRRVPGPSGIWSAAPVAERVTTSPRSTGVTSGFFNRLAHRQPLLVTSDPYAAPGWSLVDWERGEILQSDRRFNPVYGTATSGERVLLCGLTVPTGPAPGGADAAIRPTSIGPPDAPGRAVTVVPPVVQLRVYDAAHHR